MLKRLSLLASVGWLALTVASVSVGADEIDTPAVRFGGYRHVLLISFDGMHAIDFANWVKVHPHSALAQLAERGVYYPNAMVPPPTDSFPGMLALVTGGTAKTAGLFYDDSYDRRFYPSKAFYTSQGMADPGCVGNRGTEITNFEALDKTYDFSTGLVADYRAGGTPGHVHTQLDPNNMQRRLEGSNCIPVFPHEYVRTNTVFEVIKQANMGAVWSDKHPAYEDLAGPSGKGLDELFAPEINSQDTIDPGAAVGDDYTKSFTGVRSYDTLKVNAVLNWIDGYNSERRQKIAVPAIFGMNFQAVSVGQKLAKAGAADADKTLVGGYADINATPASALRLQLQFIDKSLGMFMDELQKQGLSDSTLIIVTAKHGQSPIDRNARVAISDSPFGKTPGFGSNGFEICDDAGYIWLSPQLQQARNPTTGNLYYDDAKKYLLNNAATLHITRLLDRSDITPLYGDPFANSRAPDFVAITQYGAICTGGSKLAEHGGWASDDRNVVLVLGSRRDHRVGVSNAPVSTTQVAPTILWALGLDPSQLNSVRAEGTEVLPSPR